MFSHYIKGKLPMSDAFTGTVYSAVVSLKYYGAAEFIVFRGGGALGTALLTVEACSDINASQVQPVEFHVVRVSPGDTHSVPVPSSGYTIPGGGSDLIICKIRAGSLARWGWDYARLKSVEQTVGMVAGAILVRLEEPRYGQVAAPTAITLEEEEAMRQSAKIPVPPTPPHPTPPVPVPPTPGPPAPPVPPKPAPPKR
jgi:hypothetical protein